MDREYIIQRLEWKLGKARKARNQARKIFFHDLEGNGLPAPDGTLAIRQSAQSYNQALIAAEKALDDQTNFIVYGTVPQDLDSDLEI